MSIELTLPWPPTALSPNARQHWAKLARAKKAYRLACAWQAKASQQYLGSDGDEPVALYRASGVF